MHLRLREWRHRRLLTQAELAALSGVDQTAISQIERGQRVPEITTVRKLAAALGVTGDELIVRDGKDMPDGRA